MTFTLGQVLAILIILCQIPRVLHGIDRFCVNGNTEDGSILDPLTIAVLCALLAFK
jgi:hypothetical protein